MSSGVKSFFSDLRKKRIIEILAAFIGGGWLLIEVVERLLVSHYHFPERTIDITVVTLIAALVCTLLWRWFSGREEPRKFKLELVLIPLVLLVTVLLDLNLLLHLKAPESEAIPASKWKNSIAVLPFVDMSPQKDQEYFCDGMTEELINRLSNIKELKVPARTSVFTFKGKADDIREIGKKLDVQNILEGSIRKEGNQLRVTVQLINVSDSFHVWSETFDRELTKVFDIQDQIALAVADKLKFTLLREEKARLKKSSTTDSNAIQLYFRGKYYRYTQRSKDLLLARDYFEQTIRIDPSFAAAYAGLAEDYMILGHTSVLPRDEAASKALGAAKSALELDDTLSEAYVSMGAIKMVFNWDWKGAEREFKKAVALNQNNFDAYHEYGWFLLRTSRYDEAENAFVHEKEIDPMNPMLFRDFRLLYLCQGYVAEDVKKRLKEISPDWAELWEETYPTLEKAEENIQVQGRYPNYIAELAIAYFKSGNSSRASKLIEELESLYMDGHEGNVAYILAKVFYEHNEKDKAFMWLERAVEKKATMVINASLPVNFKSLQKEPRYQVILKRTGLKS